MANTTTKKTTAKKTTAKKTTAKKTTAKKTTAKKTTAKKTAATSPTIEVTDFDAASESSEESDEEEVTTRPKKKEEREKTGPFSKKLRFTINFIETTLEQIRNSIINLNGNNVNRNINIQDCFRPSMSKSVKQYKLFTRVPMYSFSRKYVEIDIAHLKALLRKVQNEIGEEMEMLEERPNEDIKQSGTDPKRGNPKIRKKSGRVKKTRKGRQKTRKRRLKPFEQDDRIPLVALKDAVFPSSMKGAIPGAAGCMVKLLKKAEREGLLVTVLTCSNCSRNQTQNLRIDSVSLFSVLLCLNQNCNTIWQRDINASRNMHRISWNVINNNQIPALLRR